MIKMPEPPVSQETLGWVSTFVLALGWIAREGTTFFRGRGKNNAEVEEIRVKNIQVAVDAWREITADWERRFKQMEDEYRDTISRLERQLKEEKAKVERLERRLQDLEDTRRHGGQGNDD